jgi:hypothetical protein
VLGHRRRLTVVAAAVGEEATSLVVDLDDRAGEARLHLLAEELEGDAVEMPVDLDVVVDVCATICAKRSECLHRPKRRHRRRVVTRSLLY